MTPAHACFEPERAIAAPPAWVRHLLTDPAARSAWSPPSPDEVVHFDATDVREDGTDHHRCGPRHAPEMHVETRWLRLAPDTVSFIETLRRDGSILGVRLVTCTLAPRGGRTALSTHVAVTSLVGDDLARAHRTGWTQALDNLAAQHTEVSA